MTTLSRAARAFRRCTCGREMNLLGHDATEPKDVNVAREAADGAVVGDAVQRGARMGWKRSAEALRALFADGRERTNKEVAKALGLGDAAVSQILRRSLVVERVRPGRWRLRGEGDRG